MYVHLELKIYFWAVMFEVMFAPSYFNAEGKPYTEKAH